MATSVTFGLIPLFTLPLIGKGMVYDSILFYRFLFASLALAAVMLVKKETFRIDFRDLPVFILLAFFYTFSSLFLLYGYGYMGAGVATTLHFTYPVFVTLIMFFLFREKTGWRTWLSIALAVCGVALLSLPESGLSADVKGILYSGRKQLQGAQHEQPQTGFLCLCIYHHHFRDQGYGIGKSPAASGSCLLLQPVLSCSPSDGSVEYHTRAGGTEHRGYADFGIGGIGAADGSEHRRIGLRRRLYSQGRFRDSAGIDCSHGDNIDGYDSGYAGQGFQEDPPASRLTVSMAFAEIHEFGHGHGSLYGAPPIYPFRPGE